MLINQESNGYVIATGIVSIAAGVGIGAIFEVAAYVAMSAFGPKHKLLCASIGAGGFFGATLISQKATYAIQDMIDNFVDEINEIHDCYVAGKPKVQAVD